MRHWETAPIREGADLDGLVSGLAEKRVVMLGEATHGTAEFYTLRAMLTERLIREHGFSIVAVEGDWPDAARLTDYIRTRAGGSARKVLRGIHRWPTWMWGNEEVADFAERVLDQGVGFYGLDVYSLFESMVEVLVQLGRIDPELAARVAHRYSCFDRFHRDEKAYARSLYLSPEGCEAEVVRTLEDLLALRLERETARAESLFDAQQNARVVMNAEAYYRSMIHGGEDSWNFRDRHMIETLEAILQFRGSPSKAVIWAHNTHVGDYRATDMVTDGLVNLGGLAREKWGKEQVALVGFGTHRGTVIAAPAWGASPQSMSVPRGREESLEDLLHQESQRVKSNSFWFWTRDVPHSLKKMIGHRAIGVVYDPRHERGNYVPTFLEERYDAFVFVDESRAVTPLLAYVEKGDIPETWPSGQ